MPNTLRYIVPLAVSLALAPLATARGEGPAVLLRDIAAGASSGPSSGAIAFTPFRDKVGFVNPATGTGNAVWVSDGTGPGTRVVFVSHCEAVDCPGPAEILGAVNGFLVFSAPSREGDRLLRLWRTDGTRAGTIALTPTNPAPAIGYLSDGAEIVAGDKTLFFANCDSQRGCDLWGSDAMPTGTRVVKSYPGTTGLFRLTLSGDLLFFNLVDRSGDRHLQAYDTRTGKDIRLVDWKYPEASFYSPPAAVAAGRIFFFAPAQHGIELWASDGTAKGTRALTQFENDHPVDLFAAWVKAIGGRVYFVADDVHHGHELWRSDGTPGGTQRVSDFGYYDALTNLTPDGVVEAGGKVLFQATDGVTATKLWISDGRPESTAPFRSLCTAASCPPLPDAATRLAQIGGRAFIRTDNGYWSTDGTWAGTHEFWDKPCSSCYVVFQPLQQKILFSAEDAAHGRELWWSDGTAAGTRRITDMPESVPTGAAAVAGKWTFFPAGGRHGAEPWVTDGQESHLVAILDGTAPGSGPEQPTAVGDRLFFTACDGLHRSLWVSAGTPETTTLVPQTAGECNGSLDKLASAAGRIFFLRYDASSLLQLWSTAGDEPLQMTSLPGLTYLRIESAVDFRGRLWIPVSNNAGHEALWTSDGTPPGTGPALDEPDWGILHSLQAVGDELYFGNYGRGGERELWRTDGTAAGTRKLASGLDPTPGFVRLGSAVLFAVQGLGDGLWKTDGTAAGTVQVKGGFDSVPQELTVVRSTLFFFALSDGQWALWRSDGTLAGTAVLARFSDLFNSLGPRFGPAVLGGNLFFAADDGVHGRELWTSDGTVGGTRMVRDVEPGAGSSSPTGLLQAGGALFFSANDGAHGTELWTSDGTAAGTRMVQDIFPEAPSSKPGGLTAAGAHLFFAADDGATGREMWSLPLDGPDGCRPSSSHLCLSGGRYQVDAVWRTAQGQSGTGTAVPLSAETGYFWFFSSSNVEAIVKVLDGQGINGHVWVFYGALSNVEYTLTVTDTQTGLTRRYFNPLGQLASVGDTHAFGPLGANAANPRPPIATAAASPLPLVSERPRRAATVPCQPGAQRLCLGGGRFAVDVAWKDFQGHTGKGTSVPLSVDTGSFWFFNAANVELVVKTLDGRPVNGHFWLFYGALSNVEYTLTVTDTQTGKAKTYTNPSGRFASVADTQAF